MVRLISARGRPFLPVYILDLGCSRGGCVGGSLEMNNVAAKEDFIVSSPALIMTTYSSEKYTWFCKMGVRKLISTVYIKVNLCPILFPQGEIIHLELNTVGITIPSLKDAVDRVAEL